MGDTVPEANLAPGRRESPIFSATLDTSRSQRRSKTSDSRKKARKRKVMTTWKTNQAKAPMNQIAAPQFRQTRNDERSQLLAPGLPRDRVG